MNWITSLVHQWSRRSITTKFGLAFGLLLILMTLGIALGYALVNNNRNKAETAILTSMQIQKTVLEMDGDLEKARRLQRDFFLRYPDVGFKEAHDNYAVQAVNEISNVVSLSDRLKSIIANAEVSEGLQKSADSVNRYHSAAQRYQQTFEAAVDLVTQLANSDTGLSIQLSTSSTDLYVALSQIPDPTWMELYREIQLDEKDYFITQHPTSMQNALNTAQVLKQKIEYSSALEVDQKEFAIEKITRYSALAGEIINLDTALNSKLNDFDLQAQDIDPISADLIALANSEVARAQNQIDQTNQIGTLVLVIIVLAGVSLSIMVALGLNRSLAADIISLTHAASQLEAGDLGVTAHVNSEDELGKLAKAFNSMAAQLQSSFKSIQANETRYRTLFEDSPISLWEEDGSALKEQVDRLNFGDTANLYDFLVKNPDEVLTLIKLIRVVDINQATLEIFKTDNKADLINNLTATFSNQTYKVVRDELVSLASGMPYFQGETVFYTMDGEEIQVTIRVNIVSGYEKTWGRILVSMTDITERIRAEEHVLKLNDELEDRVQKRTEELESANKELESFAYSVSHDLRSPLRGMDGFSLLLLEDYSSQLDEQGQNYLKRIRATTQRMARLIDDLLKLSRVTRSEISRQEVDLSKMANEVSEELVNSQPQRHVEWSIAENLVVKADPGLMHIVLDNLLGNAFKFTSKQADAKIEMGSFQENKDTIYFVSDNGAGFDMAYKDKLFGTFQRLHNINEFEGTGIGLALVQRVILRHGGQIWAEGALEKGATVYFTLAKN